jgi:hypothetical protein
MEADCRRSQTIFFLTIGTLATEPSFYNEKMVRPIDARNAPMRSNAVRTPLIRLWLKAWFFAALQILFILPSHRSVSAQDVHYINDVLARPFDPDSKYYVSFCSQNGLIGHSFIAIGVDDPRRAACRIDAAIGLYPKQTKKNRSKAITNGAQGGLFDEVAKQTLSETTTISRLTVPIDSSQFEILKIKIGAHADGGYQLFAKDCVTFCEEVAKILDLRVPDRTTLMASWLTQRQKLIDQHVSGIDTKSEWEAFPVFYLKAFSDLNSVQ